ncbi:RNaseH domain-containing protein [Streptomyces longwoodensis]|uniref:RNaseH domain-containing protein n=1 Tax=Streptomyces longwoodensis TaxID=68231 RepID=UPI002250DA62|nr:RNaseH domain-containing protein [Streptomyces longwoodensis]MCX5000893.1 RNaseH domain-containing protein [Streptomyces longwoodensis]
MVSEDRGRLFTLSFPLDERLLGMVHVYPQDEAFAPAWRHLPRPRGKDAVQPIASLQTAARAVTGERLVFTNPDRPARTGRWAGRSVIVTPGPLDEAVVRTLMREWETRLEGHDGRDTLAALLQLDDDGPQPLSSLLHHDSMGRITGPRWAFRVAGWRLAGMLAAQPLPLDESLPALRFHLDSEGDLLAWQAPLVHERTWTDEESGKRRRIAGYAMERIHIEVEAAPGGKTLIAHLSARISRVATHYKGIRNVLLRHPVNPDIILKAPITTRWEKGPDGFMQPKDVSYRGATAQIVEACGVGRLPDPPLTGLDELGKVRGVHRTGKHPIDKGVGAMFHARLEEHAGRVFEQEPVVYTGTSVKITKPGGSLPPYVPADKMAAAMASAQLDAVRTVVLYESAQWRTRVMGQLARDYARPELAALPDEQPVVLAPRYELVTVRLPELVRHGSHDRSLILNSLPWFKPSAGRSLVTALCETRYPSEQEKEAGVTDAKHALKGLFAERGIPSQFITMDSDPGDPYRLNTPEKVARARARTAGLPEPEVAYKDDHAVQIALGSLHCDSGIIDNRLAATAFHRNARESALDREAVAVGLWTRHHRFAERAGRPRTPAVLVITLVAMQIPLGEDAYWPTLMYSDLGWRPLAQARALHHAGPIGKRGHHLRDDRGGPDNVRAYVERALAALGERFPLIVFAEERERIWPGLCNDRLGNGLVPGQSLIAQERDVAVVRVGNGQGTPQPSRRTGGGGKLPANPLQPVMPEKILYRHDYDGVVSWLFSGQSRQHAGGQRTGTQHTRRTLPSGQLAQMGAPFHAMTRTEYVIAHRGGWREEQLAGLAARLSEQAAMWDGRTNLPAPLHLAKSADEKHPGFGEQEDFGA